MMRQIACHLLYLRDRTPRPVPLLRRRNVGALTDERLDRQEIGFTDKSVVSFPVALLQRPLIEAAKIQGCIEWLP